MEQQIAGGLILIFLQWMHTIAAAVWIGGGVVIHLLSRPNGASNPSGMVNSPPSIPGFDHLIKTAMWTLLLTGGMLVAVRLSQSSGSVLYVVILTAKVALVGAMFWIVSRRRRNSARKIHPLSMNEPQTSIRAARFNTLILIGVLVFFLSEVLSAVSGGWYS